MLWLRMGALEHVGPIIPFELWECKLLSVSVMAERMGGGRTGSTVNYLERPENQRVWNQRTIELLPMIEGPAICRSKKEGSGRLHRILQA